jgi:Cu2+-exporting ATPase
MAAALEKNSEHPIATGIMGKAKELAIVAPAVENFKAITGQGVEAKVEGRNVRVVIHGYLKKNLSIPGGYR